MAVNMPTCRSVPYASSIPEKRTHIQGRRSFQQEFVRVRKIQKWLLARVFQESTKRLIKELLSRSEEQLDF